MTTFSKLASAVGFASTAEQVTVNVVIQTAIDSARQEYERVKQDKPDLTPSDVTALLIRNFVVAIAVHVAGRLTKPSLKGTLVTGELPELTAVEKRIAETDHLVAMAKESKTADVGRQLIEKDRETITAQEQAVTRVEDLIAHPEKAKAAGIEFSPDVKEMVKQAGEALAMDSTNLRVAELMSKLRPIGPNDYVCDKGKLHEIVWDYIKAGGDAGSIEEGNDDVTGAPITRIRFKNPGPGMAAEITITELTTSPSSPYVTDLASARRRDHILFGEIVVSEQGVKFGGGHLFLAAPDKAYFPLSWSEDQVIHAVTDIVTGPSTQWYAQTGSGGMLTNAGEPAIWRAWAIQDGVRIRVVWKPATQEIVTAFPDPTTPATGTPAHE